MTGSSATGRSTARRTGAGVARLLLAALCAGSLALTGCAAEEAETVKEPEVRGTKLPPLDWGSEMQEQSVTDSSAVDVPGTSSAGSSSTPSSARTEEQDAAARESVQKEAVEASSGGAPEGSATAGGAPSSPAATTTDPVAGSGTGTSSNTSPDATSSTSSNTPSGTTSSATSPSDAATETTSLDSASLERLVVACKQGTTQDQLKTVVEPLGCSVESDRGDSIFVVTFEPVGDKAQLDDLSSSIQSADIVEQVRYVEV